MKDVALEVCRQLIKIDNRPHKELAKAMGVTAQTVRRLRNGDDISWVRSTTISGLVRACHRVFILKRR